MTYSRQDLRLICEQIELELTQHTRFATESDGILRPQEYTYITKEVIDIIRKHLYIRPTEDDLQGVVKLLRED